MSVYQIIAVAVGLGLDAMSVCMAVGVKWHGPRQKFRLAWHMGLFQFLMPVIGWAGGRQLAGLLEAYGRYIAAGLVFAVGVKMLYEALKGHTGGRLRLLLASPCLRAGVAFEGFVEHLDALKGHTGAEAGG
ncbi:MAG TPA: manganese efflux pump, partial [Phycisphaerae bacterium]|nr:manganese efflux pump [Phycisphaerae bacterium]